MPIRDRTAVFARLRRRSAEAVDGPNADATSHGIAARGEGAAVAHVTAALAALEAARSASDDPARLDAAIAAVRECLTPARSRSARPRRGVVPRCTPKGDAAS